MSLEDQIAKLTTAVENLTEAFVAHTNDAAPAKATAKPKVTAKNVDAHLEAEEAGEAAPAAKPATVKPKVATTIVAERQAKAEAAAPKAAPAADGSVADPAYAPVKAAILDAIAKNHRPEIQALFKKYKVKNGQELDSSTYDDVLGDIDAIVNGEGELA